MHEEEHDDATGEPRVLPRLVNPVALCHGFMGFGTLAAVPYFNPELVDLVGEASPAPPVVPVVDPLASIATRAAELEAQLDAARKQIGGDDIRFNVIAHSMAGLDVRYLISVRGRDDLIASLTTLGTPHHGSAVADVLINRIGEGATAKIVSALGVSLSGLRDLTTTACAAFNAAVPDSPNVVYLSVASMDEPASIHPYAVTSRILRRAVHSEGTAFILAHPHALVSDGLVTVESATWGTLLPIIGGVNHTDLVGLPWVKPVVQELYKTVIHTLARTGL